MVLEYHNEEDAFLLLSFFIKYRRSSETYKLIARNIK